MNIKELRKKADQIRWDCLNIIPAGKSVHWGGVLSQIEILTVLFFKFLRLRPKNPGWPNRDRIILSKGHGSLSLYMAMAHKGFFPKKALKDFNADAGKFPCHCHRLHLAGIEASTGALGQGLSLGIGMALAGKLDRAKWRVYVVASDGECTEGQFWEAGLAAAKFGLDNLTLIVDNNRMTLDDKIEVTMPSLDVPKMWRAAGWQVLNADGHNIEELVRAIGRAKKIKGSPSVVVANTIKGKGVSFMEMSPGWHGGKMTEEERDKALEELKRKK